MRYDVDRSKRTVTATIENCDQDLLNWVTKKLRAIGFGRKEEITGIITIATKLGKGLYIPHSFTGKAVCAEEDEFDVETGKILAARRAQEKYERARMRVLENVTANLTRRLIEMNIEQTERYTLARGKVLEAEQLVKMIGKV